MAEDTENLDLFKLDRVATATKINISVFNSILSQQTIVFVLECGDVLFYHNPASAEPASIRCVPWLEDPHKRIQAAAFDPTSGNWLLVACEDGSLFLLPTQVSSSVEVDQDWPLDDVTALPSLCGLKGTDFSPSAVAWWDRTVPEARCQSIAIIGGKRGELIFANLRTGCVVGHAAVDGVVSSIQVCKDDSLIDSPPVFLLITNEHNIQWKLVLEDKETGYCWPLPSQQSRTESTTSLISGSEESVGRVSLGSFPLARARLQGLKQLSVEKLATLRQKLTETRNRGVVNVSVKRRGSSSSEESLPRQRSSVSSDTESLSGCGAGPRLDMLSETSLQLQVARGKPVIVGHYGPAHVVSVYEVGVNMSPLSVHRLPGPCCHVRLTDWLLYVRDPSRRQLSVISYRMSQC